MSKSFRAAAYAAVLFYITAGCTMPSIKQVTDPKIFYKRDVRLNVNGRTGLGVVVALPADSYSITGTSRGDLALASVRSCHREWTQEDLGGNTFNYNYVPSSEMELGENCILEIGGFDIKNGRHSWGLIAFEDPKGVPAIAHCNGQVSSGRTTICQSPAGLEQEVIFEEEMAASPDSGDCEVKSMATRGKVFRYIMPPKNCVLIFGRVADGGVTYHRHLTVGYEETLLREN